MVYGLIGHLFNAKPQSEVSTRLLLNVNAVTSSRVKKVMLKHSLRKTTRHHTFIADGSSGGAMAFSSSASSRSRRKGL
jgi:hypothetical protein